MLAPSLTGPAAASLRRVESFKAVPSHVQADLDSHSSSTQHGIVYLYISRTILDCVNAGALPQIAETSLPSIAVGPPNHSMPAELLEDHRVLQVRRW